jgi:calcineurin-like phosphoesterase family protein
MNYDLIRRWNARVEYDDIVYFLGDFAMGPPEEWRNFCQQLVGRKILVKGNHDRVKGLDPTETNAFFRKVGFEEVHDNIIVEVDGKRLWLNHYPPASDDPRDMKRPPAPGAFDIALCGHIHDKWKIRERAVNVGVDVWRYAPIALDDIQWALADAQSIQR